LPSTHLWYAFILLDREKATLRFAQDDKTIIHYGYSPGHSIKKIYNKKKATAILDIKEKKWEYQQAQ